MHDGPIGLDLSTSVVSSLAKRRAKVALIIGISQVVACSCDMIRRKSLSMGLTFVCQPFELLPIAPGQWGRTQCFLACSPERQQQLASGSAMNLSLSDFPFFQSPCHVGLARQHLAEQFVAAAMGEDHLADPGIRDI